MKRRGRSERRGLYAPRLESLRYHYFASFWIPSRSHFICFTDCWNWAIAISDSAWVSPRRNITIFALPECLTQRESKDEGKHSKLERAESQGLLWFLDFSLYFIFSALEIPDWSRYALRLLISPYLTARLTEERQGKMKRREHCPVRLCISPSLSPLSVERAWEIERAWPLLLSSSYCRFSNRHLSLFI